MVWFQTGGRLFVTIITKKPAFHFFLSIQALVAVSMRAILHDFRNYQIGIIVLPAEFAFHN